MRPLLSIWTKPIETFEYLAERRLAGKENHLGFLIACTWQDLKNIQNQYPDLH